FEPADHLIERRRQTADLISRAVLFDSLVQVSAADALGRPRQPIDWAQRLARKPQTAEACQQQCDRVRDRQQKDQLLLRPLHISKRLADDNEEHLSILIARGPGDSAYMLGLRERDIVIDRFPLIRR